ncbi:MAG: arginine decarboxylase, partial [Clostridia bacterium]|nr:arginine decarboxylase [Clostridia bacterium]
QLAAAGLPCLAPAEVTGPAAAGLDVTRLLLPTAPLGASGPQVAAFLRQAGQEVELAGPDYILLILTPGDNEAKIQSLLASLLALPRPAASWPPPGPGRQGGTGPAFLTGLPRQALSPREAWLAPRREVPLWQAEGQVAAELVAPCPPGLALVVPGEVLTGEVIARLEAIRGPEGKVLIVG